MMALSSSRSALRSVSTNWLRRNKISSWGTRFVGLQARKRKPKIRPAAICVERVLKEGSGVRRAA